MTLYPYIAAGLAVAGLVCLYLGLKPLRLRYAFIVMAGACIGVGLGLAYYLVT